MQLGVDIVCALLVSVKGKLAQISTGKLEEGAAG
jgi:hypothetical protein